MQAQYGMTVTQSGGRGMPTYAGGPMMGQESSRPVSMNMALTDIASVLRLADVVREDLETPLPPQERRNTRRMSVVGEPQWVESLVRSSPILLLLSCRPGHL